MSKKIWIVVCEGGTDYDFISHYHDETKKNIKLKVYSGDFLTDYKNSITNSNVIEKVQEYFEVEVMKLINSKSIVIDDIEKLVYMTDSDQCFELNTSKGNYLYKMSNTLELEIQEKKIPFQVLIMSNDLEHVLWDKNSKNMDVDEKEDLIDEFVEKFKNCDLINKFFLQNDIYQFQDYEDFRTRVYVMKGRQSNLNTIYANE